jgi:hypothetical protein
MEMIGRIIEAMEYMLIMALGLLVVLLHKKINKQEKWK